MNSTRVRFMARLLAFGIPGRDVNRIVAACDEAKRLCQAGLDPHLGVMVMKAIANDNGKQGDRP